VRLELDLPLHLRVGNEFVKENGRNNLPTHIG